MKRETVIERILTTVQLIEGGGVWIPQGGASEGKEAFLDLLIRGCGISRARSELFLEWLDPTGGGLARLLTSIPSTRRLRELNMSLEESRAFRRGIGYIHLLVNLQKLSEDKINALLKQVLAEGASMGPFLLPWIDAAAQDRPLRQHRPAAAASKDI